MTDTMTPEQRHRCMSHIRSKDTKPELKVRRWLWSHGYRYRLNVKSVPGKPDIVMRPYRTAIFVNGCFWHGHHLREAQMYDVRGMKSEEPQSGNITRFTRFRMVRRRQCRQRNKAGEHRKKSTELQVLQDTLVQPRVLGGQNQAEPGARPRELPRATGERLACHRRLGVPVKARRHRAHYA